MDVEESDVRKPRGRRSRNNSSNSKDPKSEMRGTNGNAEGKLTSVSDLPNGDEALLELDKSGESTGDNEVEEKENTTLKMNASSSSDGDSEKDCISKVGPTNGEDSIGVKESRRGPSNSTTESDEDFMGFESGDDTTKDPCFSFLQKFIGKYETEGGISDDDLTEEEREYFKVSQEYSSDAYWSGTSSPTKMDGLSDALGGDELCSSNASSPSVASGFSGDAKPRGKKSQHVDLSNPAFRKPLDMGWRRELVYRNMSDTSQKRMADVYYYTPTGKKVRSAREVAEHLTGTDLSDDNFTFFKMALGLNDPTKEIIRDAKRGAIRESSGTPPQKIPKLSKNMKSDGLAKTPVTSTAKDEASGSPKVTPKNFPKGVFPRIKVTPVRSNQQPSPSRPRPQGRPKKDSLALAEGELEIGMLPPSWKEPTAVSGARKVTPPSTPVPVKPCPSTGNIRPSTKTPPSNNLRYPLVVLERCDVVHRGCKLNRKSNHLHKIVLKRCHEMAVQKEKEDGYVGVPVTSENHFMQFFMQNLSVGYSALQHVFQFLKMHELLRAARVCRMWNDLAAHQSLWRTVRMKNSQVLDWEGCAAMLSRRGTRHLDLRKMLLDTSKSQEMWNQFCTAIGQISSLRHLDLCRCPSSVVERVAAQCPQLTNLIALFLHDPYLDLKTLKTLTHLEELRLKGLSGLKLRSPLDVITNMAALKHLSLTTVKDLGNANPESLACMTQLESLELGECNEFNESFGSKCLPCLKKLTRLRLEMGQANCPTFVILSGVHSLPSLTHLELVNFDIKPGFDEALAQCTNIKRLLLIPTYLTQSATTNHMVLGGVTKLSDSLVQFVWGVTHELLHVTELFVDQCEGQKGGVPKGAPGSAGGGGTNPMQPPFPSGKKGSTGDSIPVLRPVPGRDILGPGGDVRPEEDDTSKPSPQVDILPLSQLQKLLTVSLPKTKVSILKIPFNATWRQTLGEPGH